MAEPIRTPPRYVPTLTTVVEEPPPEPKGEPKDPEAAESLAGLDADLDAFTFEDSIESSPAPLDDVVDPTVAPVPAIAPIESVASIESAASMAPIAPVAQTTPPALFEPITPTPDQIAIQPTNEAAAFRLEEELLHRVLQRIDLSLEERLTDTVSAAVQQQLDVMLPRLRGEIEQVLRTLVVEALSLELSESTGSAPASEPPSFG